MSREGGVRWTVLRPDQGGTGPVPAPIRARGPTFECGAEWGGLWGGQKGREGTGSWSLEWRPLPRTTPPPPRPSDVVLDLSQSSGTRAGLRWVALGAEWPAAEERMLNSLGSVPPSLLLPFSFGSATSIPQALFPSCLPSRSPRAPLAALRVRKARSS